MAAKQPAWTRPIEAMKSSRTRWLMIAAIALAVVLAISGVAAYRAASAGPMTDALRMAGDKAMLFGKAADPNRPMIDDFMQQRLQVREQGFYLTLFDADGKRVAKTPNCPFDLELNETGRGQTDPMSRPFTETITTATGERLCTGMYPIVRWPGGGYTVVGWAQAAVPVSNFAGRLERMKAWLWGGGISAWTMAVAALAYFSRQWRRSQRIVAEMAGRVDARNLTRQRLFIPSDDAEAAGLARTFNSLLDRLEAAYKNQQRFVADASHELRTPLTILRGEIEVALRKPRSADEYNDILKSNREEIERLSRLVENLLALAHADAGEAIVKREQVDLASVGRDICRKLGPLAEAKKIALAMEGDGVAEIAGDSVALDRILSNLVENAIRYSPPGEQVKVRVESTETAVKVEVSDTGHGIPAEHLPNIFERFYRVDKARSRDFGGAGLGLSIVKAFVEAHGGRIEVSSELGKGSTFTVWFPKAEDVR